MSSSTAKSNTVAKISKKQQMKKGILSKILKQSQRINPFTQQRMLEQSEEKRNSGNLTLGEIQNPHDWEIPIPSTYYRVVTTNVQINNLGFIKPYYPNQQYDLDNMPREQIATLMGSHIAGNGEGKAPVNSIFFSVTKSLKYARRFAEFLMQKQDVFIICLNEHLKVYDPLKYINGVMQRNYAINAKEYLVPNCIPLNSIDRIYEFKQRIIKIKSIFDDKDLQFYSVIESDDLRKNFCEKT